MDKKEIGRILKSLRTKAGFTQKYVGEQLGRKQQIIGHWETGYSQPDANTLFKLCEMYGTSIDMAFGFKKDDIILSNDENKLLEIYKTLNDVGKEKILDYAEDLAFSPKYKKRGSSEMEKEVKIKVG